MKMPRVLLFVVLALSATALLAFALNKNAPAPQAKTITLSTELPESQPIAEVTEPAENQPVAQATEPEPAPLEFEEGEPYSPEEQAAKSQVKASAQFPAFLAQFPNTPLPLVITRESFKKYQFFADTAVPKDKHVISSAFRDILPELESHRFSRESYNSEFHYVARFEKEKDMVAVVIAGSDDRFGNGKYSSGIPHVYFMMIVFDKTGKRLSRERVAYIHPYSNGYQTATLNKDGSVEARLFAFERAKNPDTEGFENNPVTGEKFVKDITFQINEKGEIKNAEKEKTAKM